MIVSEGQFKASAVAPVKYQDWSDAASSVFFEIINKWAFARPCSEQKYFITVRLYLINTSSFTFALERGWDHQPVIYFINEDTCSSVDSRKYPDDRSITRIKEATTNMCCCKFVKRSLVFSQWVEGFSKQLGCHNSVFQRSRTVLVKTKKWWCWSDAVQVDLTADDGGLSVHWSWLPYSFGKLQNTQLKAPYTTWWMQTYCRHGNSN